MYALTSLSCNLATHSRNISNEMQKKVITQATRTSTRRTRVASAGIALANPTRPYSHQAHGVVKAVGRARSSKAARSSARCPHSSLRKRAHPRRQCPVRILRCLPPAERGGATTALCLTPAQCQCKSHRARCLRLAQPSSCPAIHGLAGGCAGDVADAVRPRS